MEQQPGVVVVEHAHLDRLHPVRRHQAGHPVAAGHHRDARGRGGQQRPHLVGRARVVQHQQHGPAGEQAAEHRGLPGRPGRHPRGRDADRLEEVAELAAPKVEIELTVGEEMAYAMSPVHGERGPPDTGRAVHERYRWHGGRLRGSGEERVEQPQLAAAAGEARDVPG